MSEFKIGTEFHYGGAHWRCTDVGSRVIVAICLEADEVVTYDPQAETTTISVSDDPSWFNGPPYAVAEMVFDEYDMKGCSHEVE